MTLRLGLKEDRENFEHVYGKFEHVYRNFEHVYRKFLANKGEIIEVLIWDLYKTVHRMRGGETSGCCTEII